MRVSESEFNRMPAHLQALLVKAPNPAKDEVVGAFPSSNGSGGARKLNRGVRDDSSGWGMQDAPGELRDAGKGSAARFFYSAKASKADRNGSKHPTVKPIALMEWLATLITPPGGTILDPFAGSGTTGAAAARKSFSVVLCEREDEYVEDIKRRFGTRTVDPLARLLAWNAAVARWRAAA